MPGKDSRRNAVLVVSGSDKFNMVVRNTLSFRDYAAVDFLPNASAARQRFLETEYHLVIINCPLPDEFGHEFAFDVIQNSQASVLLAVPMEVYEATSDQVTDHGILVIPRPVTRERIDRAVRFLCAIQSRICRLEKKLADTADKIEEIRLVSKAKLVLMERQGMTEDEAHRYILKEAMNHGISRRKAALRILED